MGFVPDAKSTAAELVVAVLVVAAVALVVVTVNDRYTV